MAQLPPVGWADVATKRDLDALEERMELRFQRVEDRFGDIDRRFEAIDRRFDEMERRFGELGDVFVTKQELADQTRTIILALAAVQVTIGGFLLTALSGIR